MKKETKQKQFCDIYLTNGFNGTDAYLKVYPSANPESARRQASKLLTKIDVKAYLKEKQQELSKKSKIDREYILNEYAQLLESCKAEGLDGAGTIKDRTNWNTALKNIAKLLGLDEPEKLKHEVEHKIININYIKPNKNIENE
jgi:phage terminase small subunit